jgi:SAM-dependent methyltransferase
MNALKRWTEHPNSTREALRTFRPLPLKERLFVRARLASAPLEEVAKRVPPGRVAEIGCGHGLLTALIAVDRPRSAVVAVDPDPRKIAWALVGPGRLANVRLLNGSIDDLLAAEPASFDSVVVADVLYLLRVERWPGFLRSARALLKPGGHLLLKEAEADGSWKHRKALWQERAMVSLLRRTRGSGGLGFQPREAMTRLLAEAGFALEETVELGRGFGTPHLLYVAAREGGAQLSEA